MRYFCAVLFAVLTGPVLAQSLRVVSEFQRFDPFGNVVPVDHTGEPREILSPAQMARVCFRFGKSDEVQTELIDLMMRDGYALLTSTTLRGVASLRLCTINPRTTEQDIIGTIDRLDKFARQ